MASQKDVAEHLDLSTRQIRNLVQQAVMPGPKGQSGYNLDTCRLAYLNYLRQLSRRGVKEELSPEDIDIDKEKARLVRGQATMQDLKNEILEGRSVPTDLARDVLAKILVQVGGILATLPMNIKRKHPELEQRTIESIKLEIAKHANEAAKLDEHIDKAIDEVISESESKV